MIDVDFAPDDRDAVYNHMIEKFGEQYTAYILAIGTVSDKGCIDEIGRALSKRGLEEKYSLKNMKIIKQEYEEFKNSVSNELSALDKELKNKSITTDEYNDRWLKLFKPIVNKYDELFYYFLGLLNTNISQSMHPCGIVVSPVTLEDNYGTLYRDDKKILQIDMEDVHEISLVKYDILGLKNVGIIRDACNYAGIKYPKSSDIDWQDQNVWEDMLKCPQGIFQFEGAYAFQMLCEFKPKSIFDMSLVTAALRPSGSSYRDLLMKKEFHKNPSTIIDDMLKDNYGFLIYQEDTIKFLKDICGLSGSQADNIRRAIGRKQKDRLDAAMPSILEGYCKMSSQPRDIAEAEAKEFLQIIEDSASYQFGYNHSVAYCMIGYLCAYLRYYYTPYFIVSYLNNAQNEDDIIGGFEMAKLYGYNILPPRFRHSTNKYIYDERTKQIYKGVASIKFLNDGAAEYLYSLKDNSYETFIDLLEQIDNDSQINSRQMEILIQLQYFEEFGKNQKLLDVYKYFKSLYKRKELSKSNLEDKGLVLDDIKDCYAKETDKKYTDIDYKKILNNIEKRIPDVCVPIKEQIAFEKEVVGYISMTYNVSKTLCVVTELDTKYSPKLTLYSLGSGKQITCKINKTIFRKNQFKEGQILQCGKFEKKYKQRKIPTGWEVTDEIEWWLSSYMVVDDIKE